MFKGNNYIEVNEATMIEIAQQWLDRSLTGPSPSVVSVSHSQTTNMFKISVNDPVLEPKKK